MPFSPLTLQYDAWVADEPLQLRASPRYPLLRLLMHQIHNGALQKNLCLSNKKPSFENIKVKTYNNKMDRIKESMDAAKSKLPFRTQMLTTKISEPKQQKRK